MSYISIKKLAGLSLKSERLVVGCLSGTSIDGLDVGLCRFSGSGKSKKVELLEFTTISFPNELKHRITDQAFNAHQNMDELTKLHTTLGKWIGDCIIKQLAFWKVNPVDVDLIGSHGQTMFHAPDHENPSFSGTLQIGDADHIALSTGIPVVSDFRQKHIAGGGEGAPLAPYADWLLAGSSDQSRVLINIGGIANLTMMPVNADFNELMYGDSGPGNTLLDNFCRLRLNLPYDDSGSLARSGELNEELFNQLKKHSFFKLPFPKTTGQEVFSYDWFTGCLKRTESKTTSELSAQDVLATLTHLTAWSIASVIEPFLHTNPELFASGGGVKNRFLMDVLEEYLNKKVMTTDILGIPADAKESVLFALLAHETICGDGLPAPDGKGRISFGKISLPD